MKYNNIPWFGLDDSREQLCTNFSESYWTKAGNLSSNLCSTFSLSLSPRENLICGGFRGARAVKERFWRVCCGRSCRDAIPQTRERNRFSRSEQPMKGPLSACSIYEWFNDTARGDGRAGERDKIRHCTKAILPPDMLRFRKVTWNT